MDIQSLIKSGKVSVKGDDVIGCETVKNCGLKYKITDTESGRFQVIDMKGFAFGDGASIKGAVISALRCGVRMKDINFNGHWVPIRECLQAVKD